MVLSGFLYPLALFLVAWRTVWSPCRIPLKILVSNQLRTCTTRSVQTADIRAAAGRRNQKQSHEAKRVDRRYPCRGGTSYPESVCTASAVVSFPVAGTSIFERHPDRRTDIPGLQFWNATHLPGHQAFTPFKEKGADHCTSTI